MPQTRKSATNFQSYLKRFKTLSSDTGSNTPIKHQNKQFVRNQMKTLHGPRAWRQNKINPPLKPYLSYNNLYSENSAEEENLEKMQQNPYWDKPSSIAPDFIEEIDRINKNRSQTYKNLRRKLVKKYPQYKKKFEKEGHDDRQSENVSETNSVSKGMNTLYFTTMKSFLNEMNPPQKEKFNYFKYIKFYSRTKKRCLTNQTEDYEVKRKTIEESIPKLSYLQYMKNSEEKKKLCSASAKVSKGTNLTKKKDKILKIEKQGTRSYARLKKSLEEAIECCIVKI